jgi:hypothetical protein
VACLFAVLIVCPASTVAETLLYSGGEWDFESGFYFTTHMRAGQNASPCGMHDSCDQSLCDKGHVTCVPADKWAQVGNGWHHWAGFPTWETPGFWGICSFNANQFMPNVSRGVNSQELTMTCANGIGLIYRQADVPAGHCIRVTAEMRFGENMPDWPDVKHHLGLDPTGNTDPQADTVQWFAWDESQPAEKLPDSAFNHTSEIIHVPDGTLTIFIRMMAIEPNCHGQTFMIDDVRVYDLGASDAGCASACGEAISWLSDLDTDNDIDATDLEILAMSLELRTSSLQ